MTPTDRLILARAGVIIAARRLTMREPGKHVEIELALRELFDAQRAKALGTTRSLDCGPKDAA